jgi:CheY-like chemotaxis protein
MLNEVDPVLHKLRQRITPPLVMPQAETRTALINGSVIAYRLVPERLGVLVVDDDHDNADSLSTLIKLWGHEVRTAYGGSAGMDAAAEHRPDVMFVDVAMPVVTGLEVADLLRRRARFKDMLLIALTGYADPEHRLLCENAGFDAVLIKPVDLSVLEQWLVRVQGRRALN